MATYLAVKLLFRPGSTAFWPDPAINRPYPMWLRQIARRSDERAACLLVTGHTSITGTAALNDQLSLRRAEVVRGRIVAERQPMRERTRAEGLGSRQPIVGTGTDDVSDALDRRVEFRPLPCPALSAAAERPAPGGL
jgi:outer membrane protein OmpA-like peptidoglycan-associated protein